MVACHYCGSPSRFNPCWYGLKHPDYVPGSGDLPCMHDNYFETQRELRKKRTSTVRWFMIMSVTALIVLILTVYAIKAQPKLDWSCPTIRWYAQNFTEAHMRAMAQSMGFNITKAHENKVRFCLRHDRRWLLKRKLTEVKVIPSLVTTCEGYRILRCA